MNSLVPVTVQTGTVLKYLNVKIVQTDFGISIDQTQHIKTTLIDRLFPPNRTERLKPVDTPYRTDGEYERALAEALPATGQELKALEDQYLGSFHSIIGMFLHVEQVTRFDTGFAVTRLAQHSSCPSAPVF